MSRLPISKQDLELCAERWGLHYNETFNCIGSFNASCNDEHNAAAILDRENWLLRKGIRYCLDSYEGDLSITTFEHGFSGTIVVSVHERKSAFITFNPEQLEVTNFRSWLLVQLTLALPPEVWI